MNKVGDIRVVFFWIKCSDEIQLRTDVLVVCIVATFVQGACRGQSDYPCTIGQKHKVAAVVYIKVAHGTVLAELTRDYVVNLCGFVQAIPSLEIHEVRARQTKEQQVLVAHVLYTETFCTQVLSANATIYLFPK